MSYSEAVTGSKSSDPFLAVVILAVLFGFGLFLVGYDQGPLFSIIQGAEAVDALFIHELTHDMRNAAGLTCH